MINTLKDYELSNLLNLDMKFSYAGNVKRVRPAHTSVHKNRYEAEMESLLLSMLIIKYSTHRLILEMGKGFRYEYRNIFFADDGIVITDKKAGSNYIRFTFAPYIPLVIGAILGVGEALLPGADRCPDNDSSESQHAVPKIRVKEISPDGETAYESQCKPGAEPDEIERMVNFILISHRACLKGLAENG